MRIAVLIGAMGLMAMGGCAVIYGYGEYEDAAGACKVSEDCPGADTECGIRACINSQCFNVKIPGNEGMPINAQEPGDCRQKVCDEAGGIVNRPDDTDLPNDANECTDDRCAGGVPEHPPLGMGVPCGNGLMCDGSGACAGCTDAAQCPVASDCKFYECTNATCVAHNSPKDTLCGLAAGCDMSGTFQPAWTCDDQGACNMPMSYSCGLYACSVDLPDGCAVTCENDLGCAPGATCIVGDPGTCEDCVVCGEWFQNPGVDGPRCPGSQDRILALKECACNNNGCGTDCLGTPYCEGTMGTGTAAACKNCMAAGCIATYAPCNADIGHGP